MDEREEKCIEYEVPRPHYFHVCCYDIMYAKDGHTAPLHINKCPMCETNVSLHWEELLSEEFAKEKKRIANQMKKEAHNLKSGKHLNRSYQEEINKPLDY